MNSAGISNIKSYLTSRFKMKDLGGVDTILGIKMQRDSECIVLRQSYYIEKLLDKCKYLNFKDCKTLSTLWLN